MNIVERAPAWLIASFAVLLLAAAVQDAAKLKISNILILAILAAAVTGAILIGPQLELWQNAAILALFIMIGMPLFAAGKLGGGDVKLFAVTGFWFDIWGAFGMVVTVLIAGGILALTMIGVRMAKWSDAARSRVVALQPKSGIPYAVAIAVGGLFAIAMERL